MTNPFFAVGLLVIGGLLVVCLIAAIIIVRVAETASEGQPPKAQKAAPSAKDRVIKRTPAPTLTKEQRVAAREARALRQKDLAAIRAGYSAADVGVDAPMLAAVSRALDAFVEASKAESWRALRPEEFEASLFLREMYASPSSSQLHDYSRHDLLRQVEKDVQVPRGWIRYHITHVTQPHGNDKAIVYAHMFQDGDYSNPVRLWLVRDGSDWKLFDWEQVEFGLRESHRWAIETVQEEGGEFHQLRLDIANANTLIEEKKLDEAKLLLQASAAREFQHPRRDEWLVRLAYAWTHGSWWEETIEACHAVGKRDRVPAVYFVEGQAQAALGRRVKALALLDRYEQLVGPMPQAGAERLEILQRLRRHDEAVKQCQQQLKVLPNSSETMKQLGQMLGGHGGARLSSRSG